MRKRKSRVEGFTLIEIMIVVALIGLLASIATPTWVKARTSSQTNTCINNLRQIEGAKQQWALDTKQLPTALPTYSQISGYLKNSVSCPASATDTTFGGSYEVNDIATPATCKIVSSVHVVPPEPSN